MICPEKKGAFENVSLSRRSVTMSCDVRDSAQLLIFLRGTTADFQITEELAAMQSIKATTTAVLDAVEDQMPDDADELDDNETNVKNSTATVKVVLVPGGHVMTMAFAIGLTIEEMKHHLASELKVPLEVLQLYLNGRVVEEKQSLMELGIRPHSSTQMEMSSSDPTSYPLRLLRPPEHDSMPDVITVRVQKDEGVFKEVVVEIERSHQKKPFLGGYRHRLTGVEYHNAAVQTLPKKRPDRGVLVHSLGIQVPLCSTVPQGSVLGPPFLVVPPSSWLYF